MGNSYIRVLVCLSSPHHLGRDSSERRRRLNCTLTVHVE